MQEILFLFFIVATLLISLSFIWGRKRNLEMMKRVSKNLEEIIKPRDITYTLLGGVTGFRAFYEVDDFKNIEAVLVLLPRHSILYLPISHMMGRRDLLFIVIKLTGNPGINAHLLRKEEGVLRELDINIRGERGRFIFAGDGERDIRVLERWFPCPPQYLYHLAILSDKSHIYLKISPEGLNILEEVLSKIKEEGW
jgi:hypothetical protein